MWGWGWWGGRRKANADGICLLLMVLAEKREGWMGPHEGLKINVLLPKENLAGSTLSHSFLCESG